MSLRRLDLYIVSHVLALTAIVALALMAVQTFLAFVGKLGDVGQGSFDYFALWIYTALMVPRGFYLMLPVIAMLGTLMGLGLLASQSELTAMRAAGVSVARIGGSTLIAGAAVALLCYLTGDWLAPLGQQRAEAMRAQARFGTPPGSNLNPIWLREGDSVIQIRQLLAEDRIGAAEIYTLDGELRLRAVATVEGADYADGRWQLRGVQRTRFFEDRAEAENIAAEAWDVALSPEVLRLFVLEAKALSLGGLWQLIEYLEENRLDTESYRLAWWRKAVAPLTVMALMLFTVPFVFGPLRSSGAGQRLFVGVVIGLSFHVINDVVANTGQLYGWSPWLSAGAPTAALFAFGLWRLRSVA